MADTFGRLVVKAHISELHVMHDVGNAEAHAGDADIVAVL
jgi:hypothetical protein